MEIYSREAGKAIFPIVETPLNANVEIFLNDAGREFSSGSSSAVPLNASSLIISRLRGNVTVLSCVHSSPEIYLQALLSSDRGGLPQ